MFWNGEATTGTDHNDLDETPEAVRTVLGAMTANAAHLGRALAAEGYPAPT